MKALVHATLLAAMMGAASFNALAQETENVNSKTIRAMSGAPPPLTCPPPKRR